MNEIKSTRDLFDYVSQKVANYYEAEECGPLAYLFIELMLGFGKTEVVMNKKLELSPEILLEIDRNLLRLENHEPVQYIFEKAWFDDRWWKVNSAVLIPRPETEELIVQISRESGRPKKCIDIGTGSGIIPITLKRLHPKWEIHACDVSLPALKVCKENADKQRISIKIFPLDILHDNLPWKYDIIISNPPYIPKNEGENMLKRVVDYEPNLALFVPDHDPLLFYRVILRKALRCLNPEGKVFFEIHENFAQHILSLASEIGFEGKVIPDINGKNRIIRFMKSPQP